MVGGVIFIQHILNIPQEKYHYPRLLTDEEKKDMRDLYSTRCDECTCSAYLFTETSKLVHHNKIAYMMEELPCGRILLPSITSMASYQPHPSTIARYPLYLYPGSVSNNSVTSSSSTLSSYWSNNQLFNHLQSSLLSCLTTIHMSSYGGLSPATYEH